MEPRCSSDGLAEKVRYSYPSRDLNYFRLGSCNLSTIDILAWIILCSGKLSHACRMFNSTPGIYPVATSSIPLPVITTTDVWRYCQITTGEREKSSTAEGHHFRLMLGLLLSKMALDSSERMPSSFLRVSKWKGFYFHISNLPKLQVYLGGLFATICQRTWISTVIYVHTYIYKHII